MKLTDKQELSFYKKALKDFKKLENGKNLILEDMKWNKNDTCVGFCFYFSRWQNIYAYNKKIFKNTFPILYSLKPKTRYNSAYWYSPQNFKARINLLEQAIEILTTKIKNKIKL